MIRRKCSELTRLRQWKREAIIVLDEWEATWIAVGRPGRLGESKAAAVRRLFEDRSRCSDGEAVCPTCVGGSKRAQAEVRAHPTAAPPADDGSRCSDSAPGQDVAS